MSKNRVFQQKPTEIDTLGVEQKVGYEPFDFSIWPPLHIRMVQTRKRQFIFIVILESRVKHKIFANVPINPTPFTPKELIERMNLCGGALAEHLVERYGDTYDPSDVAKKAEETFKEMMLELDRRTGH